MKPIAAVITVLAITGVAWGSIGNVLRNEWYHHEWGYRDWQQYEGFHELADGYWGISDVRDLSLRFTPGQNVTLDTVRLSWEAGGSPSSPPQVRNVSVWIESNVVTPANYHGGLAVYEPGYDPTPWGIPSGVMISPLVGTVGVTASDMVTDHNVGVTNLVAGTTYHIRIQAAPAQAAGVDKLRLRCGSLHPNKSTQPINNNQNNNTNYRNEDGNCGCNLTPGDTQVGFVSTAIPPAVGDDCMAVLHIKDIIDPFGNPQPYNKWCEGQIWNDGIEDYAKYQEPRFELRYYDTPVMGQGTDAWTPVQVTQNWYGEKFVLQATGAGCSPPDPNPRELVGGLAMYVRKTPGETQKLTIGLLDAAGNLLASNDRLAASIPDFYDVAADGTTLVTDWGWVSVNIPPTWLAQGQTYIVAASSLGSGYEILQQDFSLGVANFEINSSSASYQGQAGHAWDQVGVPQDIVNSDVLFLTVPEPGSALVLMAVGVWALVRRRRLP